MKERKRTRKIDEADLKDILVNPTLNRRGQYICDCPFCGKEKHFYISKDTQMWDCKKCGEYGNIYKLLKRLNKTYLLGGATIEDTDILTSIKVWLEEQAESDDTALEELPVKKLPVGWKISEKSTPYLLDRGITPEDCKRYNIGATDLYRKYKNYVIIPIYDNGEIRGFLGRYGAKHVPEDKLRYNNSTNTEFGQLLFGYDEIVKNKTLTVILVEGIFDKIAVDKVLRLWEIDEIKCVCTFGKKISPEQQKKLIQKGIENVVLLYDFDAIKDIKKYGLELEESFNTTITYTMKKDIDECTKDEALEVFNNVKRPREFNEDVIGKLK
jgi:DNA primase